MLITPRVNGSMAKCLTICVVVAAASLLSVTAQALPYEILYESDADTNVNELVLNSFDSYNDLINYNYSASIVDVDISTAYSSTGLTYDGDDWHILYETNNDTNVNELVLNTFDTFQDILDYNYTATIIDVDISAAYSSTGMTYENGMWHILYESDADTNVNELVMNSFNSLNDLINYNYTANIIDVDISAAYSSTGLTYDGSLWHILYESDADTNVNEMVLNSFNSFQNLLNYNYSATIIDVDISAAYSSTGIHALLDSSPPPPGIPEPSIFALFSIGLAGMGLRKRRKKKFQ